MQLQRHEKVFGAASMLAPAYIDNYSHQVAQLFGRDFANQLASLPINSWSKPVSSAVGSHFVRVTAYQPPTTPSLNSIKAQVTQRWLDSQKQHRTQQVNQQLLAKYQIDVVANDG